MPSSTAPTGTGVANFRVPRSWDNNAPKFTTEDANDLKDFIDQVNEIISLAKIVDDDDRKKLLTSYLPNKKRTMWQDLDSFTTGTYEDFLKEIYNSYPELKQETEGTLKELEQLCAKYKGIPLHAEGKLKRFGMEFKSLIRKLSVEPAIILNKQSCQKYLDTLDLSFANTLRSSISARNLLKEEFRKAQGAAAIAAAAPGATKKVDHRKEDPILLKDLMDMAEQLAKTGITTDSWDVDDLPEVKRSSVFPMVKKEKSDERFDELSQEVASIRDSITLARKETQVSQLELLKAFQTHTKGHNEDSVSSDQAGTGFNNNNERPFVQNTQGRDRLPNRGGNYGNYDRNGGTVICFYCERRDHFARDCPIKSDHINKKWIVVEDRQTKLSDGNPVPKGTGTQAQRVEGYWQHRTVGQNVYIEQNVDAFYGSQGDESEEIDSLWDEVRTLRVKLNHVVGQGNQAVQPAYMSQVQPQFMAQAPVAHQPVNAAVIQPTSAGDDFAKAFVNLMSSMGGGQPQGQLLMTRGGKESSGPSNQGF
jgi:hypothetical protein